jgi:hypothetical protein
MSTWIDFRSEPIVETLHETIVEGTEVVCNYLWCDYKEKFPTNADAEVAAEIHQTR